MSKSMDSVRSPFSDQFLESSLRLSGLEIDMAKAVISVEERLCGSAKRRFAVHMNKRKSGDKAGAFFSSSGPYSPPPDVTNPFEIAPALRDVTLEDVSGFHEAFFSLSGNSRASNSPQTTPKLEQASLDFTTDPLLPMPSSVSPIFAAFTIYMVDTGPAPFLSLISRCPTLRLKTLRVLWCNPRHIAEMLTACPTVHTLSVQIMSNDKSEELLRSLTVNAITHIYIGPNVESIAFGVDGAAVREVHVAAFALWTLNAAMEGD
ncbi:hypothetical protein C8F04DRAFT_1261978 [Mycena alexandri]|uniref:Uncharacterized protein n=1 Tax=Mycena alexandri TaxID=1745969 RepID=A0AAD6STQ9_9AGAR|nr:hypothetical protein C8F04DRAFT_1261978 [Mycena alexandri]